MNVFNNLDKDQASMYRWLRDSCSAELFAQIAALRGTTTRAVADVDAAMRFAYEKHASQHTNETVIPHLQLAVGILPLALGAALQRYTAAVEERAVFMEGLGSETFGDADRRCENAMNDVLDEIRKLQA